MKKHYIFALSASRDRGLITITYVLLDTGAELWVTNKTSQGDTSVFVGNGEWDVIGIPVRQRQHYYPCCEDPFPEVTFYLVIQRRHLYYMCNLVIPCIVIVAMTVFVFILPSESGEKISMGITVLLSLCVFLLMVAEKMPATSETLPLIGELMCSPRGGGGVSWALPLFFLALRGILVTPGFCRACHVFLWAQKLKNYLSFFI